MKPNKRTVWLAKRYHCPYCLAHPGEQCITKEAALLPGRDVHRSRIYAIPAHIRGPVAMKNLRDG